MVDAAKKPAARTKRPQDWMVTRSTQRLRPPLKPGWKTTEFWLTVVATAVANLMAVELFPDDSVVGKAMVVVSSVLAALGYTAMRTMVKLKQ